MQKITITIETENAAFDPDPEVEVARILKDLATKLDRSELPDELRDYNGNKVGTVEVTEENEET